MLNHVNRIMLSASLSVMSMAFAARAQTLPLTEYKVAGVVPGMTADQALEAIRVTDPQLHIRKLMAHMQNGDLSLMGIAADHPGSTYEDEILLVVLAQVSGRVVEIVHERNFTPGTEPTLDTFRSAVESQYHLHLMEPPFDDASIDTRADGSKDITGQCGTAANFTNQLGRSISGFFPQPLLTDYHLATSSLKGCGISLDVSGAPVSNTPSILMSVYQHVFDQKLASEDAETIHDRDQVAADAANKAAVQARVKNAAGL